MRGAKLRFAAKSVRCAETACIALRELAYSTVRNRHEEDLKDVCRAVAQWIVDREQEVQDIERGTVSLLKQAARAVGEHDRITRG